MCRDSERRVTWARLFLFSTVSPCLFYSVFNSPEFLCQEHPKISGKFLISQRQELEVWGEGMDGCLSFVFPIWWLQTRCSVQAGTLVTWVLLGCGQ